MCNILEQLVLDIVFEEARSGIMELTLYEVSGIRNIDPMGQQDPYVQFSLGNNYKKRSKTIKNGGINPYFEEEILLLWIDQDNWVNNLKVQVLDDDAKEEKPIGETNFSLLPYMKGRPDDAKEDTYDLFYYILIDPKDETEKKEVACGEIIMKVGRYQFIIQSIRVCMYVCVYIDEYLFLHCSEWYHSRNVYMSTINKVYICVCIDK